MPSEPYPTGETLDLGRLPNAWAVVDLAWHRAVAAETRPDDRLLTAKKLDEASPSGTRIYVGVWRHLNVAMDSHRALQSMLEHHGATLFAPWNLLRPTMEASFYVLWVLSCPEGVERRRRALRLEVLDHRERLNWLTEYRVAPKPLGRQVGDEIARIEADGGASYRVAAAEIGLSWARATQKINLIDEISKLPLFRGPNKLMPAYFVKATWRILSGFQHGYGYPMITGSELRDEVPIPGGASVHAVIKDDAFSTTGYVVASMLWQACELYVRRCTRTD